MEKTTKKRVRNVVLGVTSAALVAGITSALTLAVMSDMESATNTFTPDPAITTQLAEPKWDGLTFGTEPTAGGGNIDQRDMTLGYNQAKAYTPNIEIPKNPQMRNNTADSKEYVAIRLVYQVQCADQKWHTIDPEKFKENFAVLETNADKHDGDDTADTNNYNKTDWEMETITQDGATGNVAEVYYYKDASGNLQALDHGATTSTLFDYVKPCKSLLDYTEETVGETVWMFNIDGTDVSTDSTGKKKVDGLFHDNNYYAVAEGNETKTLNDIQNKQVRILIGDSGYPRFRILVQGAAVQAKDKTITNAEAKTALKDLFPAVTTDTTA